MATMVLLALVDVMFLGLILGASLYEAFEFLLVVVVPVAGLFIGAGLIVFILNWLNRRDDPNQSRRPHTAS